MSLEGLGNLNVSNSLSSYSSPNGMNGQPVIDQSRLSCNTVQFNCAADYNRHIKDWFSKCTAVSVYESDSSVTMALQPSQVFNISVENDTVPYIVIPAINESVAADCVIKLDNIRNDGSSLSRTMKVLVCPKVFTPEEKEEVRGLNIEVAGMTEMSDIDSASRGQYRNNYAPSSFMDKICRTLAYKFNAEHGTIGQSSGYGLDSIGSNLGEAFNEGFNDIKNSLSGLFGRKPKNNGQTNTDTSIGGFGEDIH